MAEEYDYIVVGAGAAGSVLANRLAAGGSSVLVLEAGGAWLPAAVDQAPLWFTLLGSTVDWGYQSEPQPGLGDRVTYEPRGRMPGGSSNLYIMMHVRGHPSDFDNWAYAGAAGWSYEDVRPYFDRYENAPLTVRDAGEGNPNPYSRLFLEACHELGYAGLPSFNGGDMFGAGWHQVNVAGGERQGALHCYLEPAIAGGLHLRTDARVTRVLVENGRAVGVEYEPAGSPAGTGAGRTLTGPGLSVAEPGRHQVRARAEVILSAGAIETPKLLLLSGIGDPAALRAAGIPLVSALPGVGRNFHNHVLTGVITETRDEVPPGTQNLSEAALFLASQPGLPAPDLQIAFVHVPFDIIVGQQHPNAVSILPGVVRPASRGWVRLRSADPADPPLVNPNYLADPSDVDRLAYGVEVAREIFATAAFSGALKEELLPGTTTSGRDALRRFVRERADSYHHQAGSARIGIDAGAVVDPRLRVYGVDGLRVADASVMPAVPSGNPHAAIVMIAERCAEFLGEAS
jgi:choline dehydrogenase